MNFILIFTVIFMLFCGMANARGCACPAVYSPVCGADGQTYSNKCVASCAGQRIARPGSC